MTKKHHDSMIGDVFQIPISDFKCGCGQIIEKYKNHVLLIAVFELTKNGPFIPSDLPTIAESPPLLIANSLDAKIWHGHWPVIGNVGINHSKLPLPNYKVNINDRVCIENYHATRFREATPEEAETLKFRKCVAPVRLENALKAFHGIGYWDNDYDELTADYATKSSIINV